MNQGSSRLESSLQKEAGGGGGRGIGEQWPCKWVKVMVLEQGGEAAKEGEGRGAVLGQRDKNDSRGGLCASASLGGASMNSLCVMRWSAACASRP